MRFSFGACLFDSGSREVSRDGTAVPVSPKAFQLLEILIGRRPNAVSKELLQEFLWPDTVVCDANLPNLVAALRAALGDEARNSRVIRTVQRFGYAFCAELVPVPLESGRPATMFKLICADLAFALREGENILGREPDAAVWIDVGTVSRRHACIVVSGDRVTLEDLGSKNGTFLKGKAVTGPTALSDGDRLRLGTLELTLRRYDRAVSTQSLRRERTGRPSDEP